MSTWAQLDRAMEVFEAGSDVYLRLLGQMKAERFNVRQALHHLVPSMKVVDVPGGDASDFALFHPVDRADGDSSGDREPRRPRPTGPTGAMSRELPAG